MAFIPAPNVIRLDCYFRNLDLSIMENVWYFISDAPPVTEAAVVNCVNEFFDWADVSANRQWSDQVAITRIKATDMSAADSYQWDLTLPTPLAGTIGSPVIPANNSLAIKLGTGLAGRSQRGRKYWVGLPELYTTGDFLSTPLVTAILNASAALLTAMDAAGFTMAVVSYFTGGAPRTTAQVLPVTSLSVIDSRVDSQRRRLAGEGE